MDNNLRKTISVRKASNNDALRISDRLYEISQMDLLNMSKTKSKIITDEKRLLMAEQRALSIANHKGTQLRRRRDDINRQDRHIQ